VTLNDVRGLLMRVFRDDHGFTLSELLVAMALMGIVMLAIVALYVNSNALFMTETNRAEAQQGARVTLMIQEDLRMIGTGVPATQAKITAATATTITFVGDTRGASSLLTAAVAAGDTTFSVSDTTGIQIGDSINLVNGATWQNFTVTGVSATTITVGTPSTGAYPIGAQVGAPRTIAYQWNAGTETLSRDAGDGNGLLPLATGVQNFQLSYFDATDSATAVLANIRRIAITITTHSTASADAGYFTINSDARPRNL
jgi:prepilin-type N-terminal cleavage/methylation domain-containing protein